MEQTTGWARLFGNSGSNPTPTFGAAAFGAVSRPSRLNVHTSHSGSLSSHGASVSVPSSAAGTGALDLVFERVDLSSVCNSLQLLISSSPGGSEALAQVTANSSSSRSDSTSSLPEMDTSSQPIDDSSLAAPKELLEQVGQGKIPKHTIFIRKCSLAENEGSKTSYLGNLIRALPKSFKNIVFADCIMTEAAIASLCYGVLGSNHIISLTLKHNTLGSDRIKGIATGLVRFISFKPHFLPSTVKFYDTHILTLLSPVALLNVFNWNTYLKPFNGAT